MAAARRSFPTMVIASSLFAITLLGQNYQVDTRHAGTSLAGWHVELERLDDPAAISWIMQRCQDSRAARAAGHVDAGAR